MLLEKLAAQDSLRQRRGRAGRVRAGRCYRMILRSTFERLPAHTVPEILRVPLDSVVLQLKAMGYADAMTLLRECVDPPALEAVMGAENQLKAMQALTDDGQLTALGSHLANLPCAARIGKMLLYGCMLGCLRPILSIAAGLTIRSPFLTSQDNERRKEIDYARRRLAHTGHGSCRSDHLLLARAYDAFANALDKRRVCNDLCLSYERMNELRTNRRQLIEALASVGFLNSAREADDTTDILNAQSNNRRVIGAVLCAGLYPNVIKVMRPPQKYHETIGGAVTTDAEAKQMKYYVKDLLPVPPGVESQRKESEQQDDAGGLTAGLSRVWLHPGSINFTEASYNSRWLVYSEKVKTSKVYIRESTEASAYALLLFGGKLDAQYALV